MNYVLFGKPIIDMQLNAILLQNMDNILETAKQEIRKHWELLFKWFDSLKQELGNESTEYIVNRIRGLGCSNEYFAIQVKRDLISKESWRRNAGTSW